MRFKRLAIALSVVALLGAACGGDDEGGSSENGGESSGGGSATLNAVDFAFDPTDLSVGAGGTIEFTNEDDAEHNITAEDAGIDEDVEAGGSTSVSLEGVEAGSYDFICKYHPDMKGTLEVTE